MGRKRVSAEQVAQALHAFRAQPGNYRAAAEAAGIDARTAAAWWVRGPSFQAAGSPYQRRPLKEIIQEEQIAARAKLQADELKRAREAAPALASDDAASTLAREALLIRLARESLVGVGASVVNLGNMVRRISDELRTANTSDLDATEKLGILRVVANVSKAVTEAARSVIAAERERLGIPSLQVAVQVSPTGPSLAEVEGELEALQRALSRQRNGTRVGDN